MKKLFTSLIMVVLAISSFAQHYHFSAVCESGQTLYYRILSEENQEVKVTFPNNNPAGWDDYAQPEGDLVIPEFVEHEGITYTVVSIGDNAFGECYSISSVELPNSIRRIDYEAFWYCTGLSSDLVIPDQCTFIGGYAFMGCSGLSSLTIGASVNTIQYSAFEDCIGLQSIHCKTPAPPFAEHIPSNPYYEDRSIFHNVPTDIPVFVSCLTIDQFQMSQDWSRFTNLEGIFVGAPSLTVDVNNPEYGSAEVVSIPENCDELTATVRATPSPGHTFGYWKCGSVVSFDQEYTFTLKHNTTLTAYFDCIAIIDDEIAFPDHIVGRKYNASGQVTNEYPSNFVYSNEGIMTDFSFPGIVSTQYNFAHFPSRPSSFLSFFGGHPLMTERYSFGYNNYNKIEHSCVDRDGAGDSYISHYYYYYDDEMRLIEKEFYYNDYIYFEGYTQRHFYVYSDGNRTRTDSVVHYNTSEGHVSKWTLTTNHYNQRIQPLTVENETFNSAGELTAHTLKTYSYTSSNKTDSIITQTFIDGEWVNSSLIHYVYDNKNRVVEYQTGSWSAENEVWNINHKIIYDFNDEEQKLIVSFKKKNNGEWIWDTFSGQTLFYESELYEWQRAISNYIGLYINQFEIDLHYVTKEIEFPLQSEWYYEIVWDDGSTTYQHLEYASDTTIGNSRPKVIVRSNTHYDRDTINEVTHEYILEENGIVYWWNNTLQEFTTLYDYNAETGDEWEIKVGTESIIVHVDHVDVFEYQGGTFKMLQISDANDIFNGDIVIGFGHMTSFFPEKLMNQGKGFRVDGLRCYWVEGALLYHNGEEDCDAIHSELQGVEETNGDSFVVYPNPANNILFVRLPQCDSPTTGQTEYRITNLMGQTLLQGPINAENQQLDISNLPAGMYFISVDEQTVKFVVR